MSPADGLLSHTWYTLPAYSVRRERPRVAQLHHLNRPAARLLLDAQPECPYHQAHRWALVEARLAHLGGAFDFCDSRYLHRFSQPMTGSVGHFRTQCLVSTTASPHPISATLVRHFVTVIICIHHVVDRSIACTSFWHFYRSFGCPHLGVDVATIVQTDLQFVEI